APGGWRRRSASGRWAGCPSRPRPWSATPSARTGPRPRTTPRPVRRGGHGRLRRPARGGSFEAVLGRRVGLGGLRPGAQGLEPEPVEQVVDRLEAAGHTELVPPDPAHVLPAQRAHPVGLGRPGPEPLLELLLLVVGQGLLAPAPGAVDQGLGAAGVVP